jgi:DNA-binding MarR family transcriptional regulator
LSSTTSIARPTTANLGFRLVKASQRWNELLHQGFSQRGFGDVRPAYGSVLLPLWEEDGLRMGELATRARLSKQTMTTLVRLMEQVGLVARERDPEDGRAFRITLTARAREFGPVAAQVVGELDRLAADRVGGDRYGELHAGLERLMDL